MGGGVCSNIQLVSCICSPRHAVHVTHEIDNHDDCCSFLEELQLCWGRAFAQRGHIFRSLRYMCMFILLQFFFIDVHCVPLYCSGLEELENAGLQYLDSVFSEPGRSGALLICGLASSSGSGCGKSSLAKLLCKSASRLPYCAHISMIDCTTLRGRV